ncbi:MAG: J domain-containing protein [Pseudomonadota bacterium]
MAKIHTHYDNLKVSRGAPHEVIRAAYKALSQKYHPDKNPGDEKAARIMAIVNSAYGTLADPVRRREHDEWIAAEEWEIEWLESTRAEDGRERPRSESAWETDEVAPPSLPYRAARDPAWWLSISLCLALGCVAGILLMSQVQVLPAAVASALGSGVAGPAPAGAEVAERHVDPLLDSWAAAKAEAADAAPPPPDVKSIAVTQLVLPARSPDCETELHSLAAPNGEPWPPRSGYLEGFPVGNQGPETSIGLDNSANDSPVLVKIYDLDRRSNVRHVFVQANDSIKVENLAAGKYEVRYQNISVGGTRADCLVRRKKPLQQAAARQPVPADQAPAVRSAPDAEAAPSPEPEAA